MEAYFPPKKGFLKRFYSLILLQDDFRIGLVISPRVAVLA